MNAQTIRHTAAQWLERRQRADWSAADQADLETWLTAPHNMVAYLRVESAWQRAERLTALRPPQALPAPMRAQKPASRNMLKNLAAGLALIGLIAGVFYQQYTPATQDYYATEIGGRKAITFADGTRIEMNTDTVLRVSKKNAERKVWLDKGEAYFQITHNAMRPFTVMANGRRVTDLGTKFVVRQDEQKLHVAVVEGLVEVAAKDHQPQSLLKPGDVLTATQDQQSIRKKPLPAIFAALDWQYGKLFLDNATLAEAAAEFNRYNIRKLVITDPKIAKLTIAGTFQTTNLEAFANVAKDIFKLRLNQQGDQIILTR